MKVYTYMPFPTQYNIILSHHVHERTQKPLEITDHLYVEFSDGKYRQSQSNTTWWLTELPSKNTTLPSASYLDTLSIQLH